LLGERDNARNNARCTQARKTTHGLDGQHQCMEESIRVTEDIEKWRITSMVWPTLGSRTAEEQQNILGHTRTVINLHIPKILFKNLFSGETES